MFEEYNWKYWGGLLPELEIIGSKKYYCCGEYFNPLHIDEDVDEKYSIVINVSMPLQEQRDTMLHEMCHHSCFIKNKEKYWTKKIYWHGKEWREEMRRVGFTGKITKYT